MVRKPPLRFPANRLRSGFSDVSLIPFYDMARDQGPAFWEWLAAFFARLPQGIILTGPDGRVVIFNQAAASFLGYTPAEVVGVMSLGDLCKPSTGDRSPAFLDGLEGESSFRAEDIELIARDTGNGNIPSTFKAHVCGLYGHKGELLGIFANLGSLNEYRAATRERRTMVRKVSIGKIVSALAHEINNPLQTLRTSLELGLDSRKPYQRRRNYLEVADAEISRISHIIMVLRRFYPSNDNENLSADVNFSIHAALDSLTKDLRQHDVRVRLELSDDLPPVRLIAHQLQNIFLSLTQDLLSTAWPGSSLEISTRRGHFDNIFIVIANVSLHPEVPLGLDPFDPQASVNREARLALGLSISREIIIEHGGSLEMTGEDNKTFQISLPLA